MSLQQIRLVVFAKNRFRDKVSHVQTSTAATGVANTLGNKGGVGVSFFLGTTSFCFVNAHLAAGTEKLSRRNKDYRDILSKLQLGDKKLSVFDPTNQFHHVFFFGDLNYRVQLPVDTVLELIKQRQLNDLFRADQLQHQRARGNVLWGFEESQPTFVPTYRYKRGTRAEFAYEKVKRRGIKINVPSWCDRVLWRSFPGLAVRQTSYGCTTDIMTSDHSPVFSTFEVRFTNQYVPDTALSGASADCTIEVSDAELQLDSSMHAGFVIDFYAAFADGPVRSPMRDSGAAAATEWRWEGPVAAMKPFVAERRYLESEGLLVAIKTDEGEPCGEGCISLYGLCGESPGAFACELSHHGARSGVLRGSLRVTGAVGRGQHYEHAMLREEEVDEDDSIASFHSRPRAAVLDTRKPEYQMWGNQISRRGGRPGKAGSGSGKSLEQAGSGGGSADGNDESGGGRKPPPAVPRAAAAAAAAPDPAATAAEHPMQAWLDSLGFGQHFGAFVENGYDDVDFVADIEADDLAAIGLSAEDAAAILAGIESLPQ